MKELIFNISVVYLAQIKMQEKHVDNVNELSNDIFIWEADAYFGTQLQS